MQVEIIRKYDDFLELETPWNELLNNSSNNMLYLTHEWLLAWWESYGKGNKLFVILIKDQNKIIAAAPLMIKAVTFGKSIIYKKLQFITHEVSDYMDFIVSENPDECFSLIFDTIFRHRNLWDCAEFVYLPGDSPNFKYWSENIAASKMFRKTFRKDDTAIAINMYGESNNYSELENIIPGKERIKHVLRKKYAKLLREKKGIILERVKDFSKIEAELAGFLCYYGNRCETKGISNQFDNPVNVAYYLRIARRLAPRGWVEFSSIKSDNDYMAMIFGYIYNNKYYHYTSAFNPVYSKYSPSQLHIRLLLESFYKEGIIKTFDFLRGNEQWKQDWSKDTLTLFKIRMYPYKIVSILIYACDLIISTMLPKPKS